MLSFFGFVDDVPCLELRVSLYPRFMFFACVLYGQKRLYGSETKRNCTAKSLQMFIFSSLAVHIFLAPQLLLDLNWNASERCNSYYQLLNSNKRNSYRLTGSFQDSARRKDWDMTIGNFHIKIDLDTGLPAILQYFQNSPMQLLIHSLNLCPDISLTFPNTCLNLPAMCKLLKRLDLFLVFTPVFH